MTLRTGAALSRALLTAGAVLAFVVLPSTALPGVASRTDRRLPGATAIGVCAAAGAYWPTMTLAVRGTSAWVACKERARVVRINLAKRKTVASVKVGAPVIAVAYGYASVWALDTSGTLSRIAPASGRITKRIRLSAAAAYNVWIGGGSVWVADDQAARVIRVSPKTNRVVARISVGDGPSDMVFNATTAWVINHRDRALFRIDLKTNSASSIEIVPGDAPERMVLLGGSLWITGRGTDLLKVDAATGEVQSTIEIGASGIDLVASSGALWVPARSAAVDQSGFPTMQALQRVSASSGEVTTVATATGRLDVHGIDARGGFVWLADNREGFLYRVRS